jgi:hypothetical protein
MIYTALYVMLLMRANTFRGQVGSGGALEIKTFLGSVKWHRADWQVLIGAQKGQISRAQPPSNRSKNPRDNPGFRQVKEIHVIMESLSLNISSEKEPTEKKDFSEELTLSSVHIKIVAVRDQV